MPRNKVEDKERERFNFTLQENERDKVVARWINAQPNASEAVKALIYAVATGNSGFASVPVPPEPLQNDPSDPRVALLMNALDL